VLSQTRRALEDFDNQHDFERMAADVLNSSAYSDVDPAAPGGGPDSGEDITFHDGETPGVAFVTLNKDIKSKFKYDLNKKQSSSTIIALFCNVVVSPSTKLEFTKAALSKGCRLDIYDLERLRSLLDSSQKDIRRRYLHIDDEAAAKLRSEVTKLIKFPDAVPDNVSPPSTMERILLDQLPRRLFDLLLRYEEVDIKEMPGIGQRLHNHLVAYYKFRKQAIRIENEMMSKVGNMVGVRFPAAWQIYVRYSLMRFGGASMETIVSWGDFLNFSITWEDAEKVFSRLSEDHYHQLQQGSLNHMAILFSRCKR